MIKVKPAPASETKSYLYIVFSILLILLLIVLGILYYKSKFNKKDRINLPGKRAYFVRYR